MFHNVEKIADEVALEMEAEAARVAERSRDKFLVADLDAQMQLFVPKTVGKGEERGQAPSWLDRLVAIREEVDVVHHSAFFKHKDTLPTYNSAVIESQIHRISGLSDVFLYLNDDVFFSVPMVERDYWTPPYGLVF